MTKRRPLYNEYDLPDKEICTRYAAGESAYAIAKTFKVATDTILRRIRRSDDVEVRHYSSMMCGILSSHKNDLKDDPNRFSGEFILYMSRKVERKKAPP